METTTVFITKMGKFLPNQPVKNEEMEEFLGFIHGSRSRSKSIILRSNGIKSRYYAVDKQGKSTHTNADMTAGAVNNLVNNGFSLDDIQLLACGTGSPDHLVPGHASMVHGVLKCKPVEIISPVSTCNSGMNALKYGYLSVLSGSTNNAVCTGSEKVSIRMVSKNYEEEARRMEELGKNPYIAFDKEFLRWMLSDGAGAALIQDKPDVSGNSLKIECIDMTSYANEMKTCMYAGGTQDENGDIIPWSDYSPQEMMDKSVLTLKQDIDLLSNYVVSYAVKWIKQTLKKHRISIQEIAYFLPHISSFFFKEKLDNELKQQGIHIPEEKWFTNLDKVGNVGAASIYLMLEELFNSGRLKKGDKLFLFIPESARFAYTNMYLTVV